MTIAKYTEVFGVAEAGNKISGDIYWKDMRAAITRQVFMEILAYYQEIIKKKKEKKKKKKKKKKKRKKKEKKEEVFVARLQFSTSSYNFRVLFDAISIIDIGHDDPDDPPTLQKKCFRFK